MAVVPARSVHQCYRGGVLVCLLLQLRLILCPPTPSLTACPLLSLSLPPVGFCRSFSVPSALSPYLCGALFKLLLPLIIALCCHKKSPKWQQKALCRLFQSQPVEYGYAEHGPATCWNRPKALDGSTTQTIYGNGAEREADLPQGYSIDVVDMPCAVPLMAVWKWRPGPHAEYCNMQRPARSSQPQISPFYHIVFLLLDRTAHNNTHGSGVYAMKRAVVCSYYCHILGI